MSVGYEMLMVLQSLLPFKDIQIFQTITFER